MTTSLAAAASAASSSALPTTSGDGVSSPANSSMATMTFFSSTATPLFWRSWQPASPAWYAASCVFLVLLAALLRVLFALRPTLLEARGVRKPSPPRRPFTHASSPSGAGLHQLLPDTRDPEEARTAAAAAMDQAAKDGVLPPRPPPGRRRSTGRARGLWIAVRAVMQLPLVGRTCQALYEMLIAGIGYLLMLAVMTYNVGYFCSVLAGIFLGAFIMADAGEHMKSDQWETC